MESNAAVASFFKILPAFYLLHPMIQFGFFREKEQDLEKKFALLQGELRQIMSLEGKYEFYNNSLSFKAHNVEFEALW